MAALLVLPIFVGPYRIWSVVAAVALDAGCPRGAQDTEYPAADPFARVDAPSSNAAVIDNSYATS
jgi:hypothetical protein